MIASEVERRGEEAYIYILYLKLCIDTSSIGGHSAVGHLEFRWLQRYKDHETSYAEL